MEKIDGMNVSDMYGEDASFQFLIESLKELDQELIKLYSNLYICFEDNIKALKKQRKPLKNLAQAW